jgi:hypothetical protein
MEALEDIGGAIKVVLGKKKNCMSSILKLNWANSSPIKP